MSGNAVSRTCGCCQTPTPWGFWPSAWADSRDMSTRLKEIGADPGLRRLGFGFRCGGRATGVRFRRRRRVAVSVPWFLPVTDPNRENRAEGGTAGKRGAAAEVTGGRSAAETACAAVARDALSSRPRTRQRPVGGSVCDSGRSLAAILMLGDVAGGLRRFATLRSMTARRFGSATRVALFLAARGCCAECGVALRPGWHADHVAPVRAGGATEPANGRALCPRCNLRKGGRVS